MADRPKQPYPGQLKYPINQEDQYNTKMVFQAVKVEPPSINSLGVANAATSVTGGASARNNGNKAPITNNLRFFDIGGERADIYVPLGGFQVADNFDYAQSSLGAIGAAAANTLNQGGTIGESIRKGLSTAGASAMDALKATFGDQSVGRLAALKVAQFTGSETAQNVASITARATMNPNIRTNFNGVAVREFSFSFKFIPCSREESLAVKSIIKFFRFHSYPEEISSFGSFSVGFEYPNMFKIRLLSNAGNKHFKNIGTPIKLCYCKSVSATYNATNPVLHEDGSPTEIDLALNFTEYKAQTRKDIENEDNDSFYHFENGTDAGTSSNPAEANTIGGT